MAGRWLGKAENPCVTIIDTPGLEDTQDRSCQFTNEIGESVRELGEIDVFLILIKATSTRLTPVLKKQLRIFSNLFGSEFWKKVTIQITFWGHDRGSRRRRNREKI